MTSRFHVQGTKVYFYWSMGLLALCLWAVKDGWFPSEDMVKHQAFNKTLAMISLVGSAVYGYIHKVVK